MCSKNSVRTDAYVFFRLIALTAALQICAAHADSTCTVIADASTGKVLKQAGPCEQRLTPASTFKIAISLMGYDSGFLIDEHLPTLPFYEGYADWIPEWKTPSRLAGSCGAHAGASGFVGDALIQSIHSTGDPSMTSAAITSSVARMRARRGKIFSNTKRCTGLEFSFPKPFW